MDGAEGPGGHAEGGRQDHPPGEAGKGPHDLPQLERETAQEVVDLENFEGCPNGNGPGVGDEGGSAAGGVMGGNCGPHTSRAGRGDDPRLPQVELLEEEVSVASSSSGGSLSRGCGAEDAEDDGCWEGGRAAGVVGAIKLQQGTVGLGGVGKQGGRMFVGQAGSGGPRAGAALQGEPLQPAPRIKLPLLHGLAQYRLHGSVCHRGSSPHSGHYIADVALPAKPQQQRQQQQQQEQQPHEGGLETQDGGAAAEGARHQSGGEQQWQWWRFDDTEVSSMEAGAALEEQACDGYLLFLVCDPFVPCV